MHTENNRIHILDILRGIAAIGVVFFHHAEWYLGHELEASDILTRFGTYGVSLFFMLSGYTLRSVYKTENFITTGFWKARFFRIYPLMMLIVIFYYLLNGSQFNLWQFASEFTGWQGLLDSSAYKPVWLWSIGNELCFYLLFPMVIFLENWKKNAVVILLVLFTILSSGFFFRELSEVAIWKFYASPWFNFHYFLLGYVLFIYRRLFDFMGRNMAIILMITALLLFLFYPQQGHKFLIVTGSNRIIYFFILLFILITSIRLFDQITFNRLNLVLIKAGLISYGIYMYHPVVFQVWSRLLNLTAIKPYTSQAIGPFTLYNLLWFGGSVVLTLLVSYCSYRFFEKRITNFFKRNQTVVS